MKTVVGVCVCVHGQPRSIAKVNGPWHDSSGSLTTAPTAHSPRVNTHTHAVNRSLVYREILMKRPTQGGREKHKQTQLDKKYIYLFIKGKQNMDKQWQPCRLEIIRINQPKRAPTISYFLKVLYNDNFSMMASSWKTAPIISVKKLVATFFYSVVATLAITV